MYPSSVCNDSSLYVVNQSPYKILSNNTGLKEEAVYVLVPLTREESDL